MGQPLGARRLPHRRFVPLHHARHRAHRVHPYRHPRSPRARHGRLFRRPRLRRNTHGPHRLRHRLDYPCRHVHHRRQQYRRLPHPFPQALSPVAASPLRPLDFGASSPFASSRSSVWRIFPPLSVNKITRYGLFTVILV